MTVEEAIEAIKIKEMQIECKATRMVEFCEGLVLAEEALEKQIPKKPIIKEYEFVLLGELYKDDNYHCPYCDKCFGELLYVDENKKTIKTKCCPDCGQKLDWGEDNERT